MSKIDLAMRTTRGGVVQDENGKPVVVSRVIRSTNIRGKEFETVTVGGRTFKVHRSRGRGLPYIFSNRPLKEEVAEEMVAV